MKFRPCIAPILAALVLPGCAYRSFLTSPPSPSSLAERLAAMPAFGNGLRAEIDIRWDDHHVPAIIASSDEDLAYGLGLVHAHLRLGQMEVFRRASQGRLAEGLCIPLVGADELVRTIDFSRSTSATLATMPPDSRRFLQRFVDGVNDYRTQAPDRPHEVRFMDIAREPFTVQDIITMSRLASMDIGWVYGSGMAFHEADPAWRRFWLRVQQTSLDSLASFEEQHGTPPGTPPAVGEESTASGRVTATVPANHAGASDPLDFLARFTKVGSNAWAVGSGWRDPAQHPILASDPHLSHMVPNLFFFVRLKSPGFDCMGLMFPGLPVLVLGRNNDLAWGTTNMVAQSTDLVRLPPDWKPVARRRETIHVRGLPDRHIEVLESSWGPVVSRLAAFRPPPGGGDVALRWVGNQPSDTLTPMIRAAQAHSFDEFRLAYQDYQVPGQNLVVAERSGGVGEVMAVALPFRPALPRTTVTVDPATCDEWWRQILGTTELPCYLASSGGCIVATNNRPSARSSLLVSPFHASNDRQGRISQLLRARAPLDAADMLDIQCDVVSPDSLALAREIVGRFPPEPDDATLLQELASWDGAYATDSRGALAFTHLLSEAIPGCYLNQYGRFATDTLVNGTLGLQFLLEDLHAGQPEFVTALRSALRVAGRSWRRIPARTTWGDRHRLKVSHAFAHSPFVGGRYRYADFPAPGSSTTIWKTFSPWTPGEHEVDYGAQSRAVFQVDDADENYFCLLGGQDGWLGSDTMLDQVDLFLRGGALRVGWGLGDSEWPWSTPVAPSE